MRAVVNFVGAFACAFSVACANADDCSCTLQGVTVHAQQGTVAAIHLSDACSGASLFCLGSPRNSQFVPGCTDYQIIALRGGKCVMSVQSSTGATFDATVDLVDMTGTCCSGVYATHDSSVRVPFSAGDAAPE